MKKSRKTFITAAVLTAAMNLSACDPNEPVQDVYGPPVVEAETSASETTADITTVTEYDPSAETRPALYGPPFAEEETESTVIPETEYRPSADMPSIVYGPPQE